MESMGSVSGKITMHIGLFPQAQEKAKTYPEGEYLHDIQTNYDHQYFYHRVKYFHSFKINESLHNLIIALCINSGEVVFANCGSLCIAVKSGICKQVSAMMPKVCNHTLHNYKNVTELQHEADENCSATCTSTLQRWHQPRVEGTSPCHILWKGLFPKHN